MRVAQLATVFQSGGNPEFGKDIRLQHDPSYNDQNNDPDTHVAPSFLCFTLFQISASPNPIRAAHGCENHAHEKPPCEAHPVEAELLPRPFPEPDTTEENADNSFLLLFAPQEGQGPLSSPLLLKQRDSKTFPHFLHLNSYIGISFSFETFVY